MEQLKNENKVNETKQEFEDWISKKLAQKQKQKETYRQQAGAYVIPVVVHIIHNGEPKGTGTNIPDAQVQSEISVLNADYNRLNSDASKTPSAFTTVAGSISIQFVLAKQDPEGLPTSGIVRVKGSKTSWTRNDDTELKSLSYWPAEDYLNIWVCNLTDYLGYTQLPESDSLQGLEEASKNRLTDGVVIAYQAFGTSDAGSFDLDAGYDLGRTATHEVGHFFGLRHVWGDDDYESSHCEWDDYVADTPMQALPTYYCPSGVVTDECTTTAPGIMYENYMDYTDDACMNLFTKDQVDRMTVVIENSPRRVSLLSSHGLDDPVMVANDLGVRSIISPEAKVCTSIVSPELEVRNYGTNTITSTKIEVLVNGTVKQTKTFTVNLATDDITDLTFNNQSVNDGDDLSFEIIDTNGGADGNTTNNSASLNVTYQKTGLVPFNEPMNSIPNDWEVSNPDGSITWEITAANNGVNGNNAAVMNFYDYEAGVSESDALITPVLDFSPLNAAALHFDYAYARYNSSENGDSLKVVVLTGCENDLSKGIVVYETGGQQMATAPSTSAPFAPSSASQWKSEVVDLTPYLGISQVQLAFIGKDGYGNNLYLDNLKLVASAEEDLSLVKVTAPGPVICTGTTDVQFQMMNLGSIPVISFEVDYTINGGAKMSFINNDSTVVPGQTINVSIPSVAFSSGLNVLSISLTAPNGETDINPANNSAILDIVASDVSDKIPLRENFDDATVSNWSIVNPAGGGEWNMIQTNYQQSIYFDAQHDATMGDESWLVSPDLDFTISTEASLFFDFSYNGSLPGNLKVMSSSDCGQTYNEITDFPRVSGTNASIPQNESQWQRAYVNLSTDAGLPHVRVALVFDNDHGNNIYVDNLEFFTAANTDPLQISKPYVIYNSPPFENSDFKITFNLDKKQTVDVLVVDMMGRSVFHTTTYDVLNQTFPIELETTAGVYIVRLGIGNKFYSTRVFLPK